MDRTEVIKSVKKYFDIDELVCDHTFRKYGENAWNFLDTDFLHCLYVIRSQILRKPMYCNGSTYHQRGLRCNLCQMVKEKKDIYLSAHILGKAGDFTIKDMDAEEARQRIAANADLLPCPIRIERGVSWLHFDVRANDGKKSKVYFFTA